MISGVRNDNSIFYFLLSRFLPIVILYFYFLDSHTALATEFTSQNFKVIDPVISIGGGRSTSASFQTEQSVGQPATGLSTSASFQLKGGFLYFPAPAAAAAAAPAAAAGAAAGGGGRALSPVILPAVLPFIAPFLPTLPAEIPAACPPGFKKGDIFCRGQVGLQDFSAFLLLSGVSTPNPADFNSDKVVDVRDLSILLSNWTQPLLAFAPEEQFGVFKSGHEAVKPPRQFAAVGSTAPSPSAGGTKTVKTPGILQKIPSILNKIIDIPRLIYHGSVRFLKPFFFGR